ncbi:DNA-directed RNA polymerase subunit delta [Spiroplasma taiwanense]|uniref:RNAP delta factor n=1 Tax=Spiroplasma taiwanense CT-1 TaxID=1276220 RepID=S5MD66_9MOLU|nr:DNA-directed RNA polymerase subunit delta [Spiroplasma taiwanense]AGR41653.1 DNA directed RNA polymerase subunit delta [Spiroplasma taiwanense CT-1]
MNKISTIELAFDFLKECKGNSSFENIWNAISKHIDGDNESKNEIIAELYSDLVLDNRFALTSDGKWGLRDYLKFEDVKKQYEYVDKFETTEEFEDLDFNQDSFDYDDSDTGENILKARQLINRDNLDDDDDEEDDDDDFDDSFEDDYDDDDEY